MLGLSRTLEQVELTSGWCEATGQNALEWSTLSHIWDHIYATTQIHVLIEALQLPSRWGYYGSKYNNNQTQHFTEIVTILTLIF